LKSPANLSLLPKHDIRRPQPAMRMLNLERHRIALLENSRRRRQVTSMHEHVAAAVIAREKPIAFFLAKELDLPCDCHDRLLFKLRKRSGSGGEDYVSHLNQISARCIESFREQQRINSDDGPEGALADAMLFSVAVVTQRNGPFVRWFLAHTAVFVVRA
jgi:hypothetical protein